MQIFCHKKYTIFTKKTLFLAHIKKIVYLCTLKSNRKSSIVKSSIDLCLLSALRAVPAREKQR